MTLVNGSLPVISIEDNFSLTYLGRYGVPRPHADRPGNDVEYVEGPLPANTFTWDGVDYLGGMEAGEQRFVPFDIVRLYFGDPRSIMTGAQRFEDRKGKAGDIAPRPEETRRLSVLYGLYDTDAVKVREIVPLMEITMADGTPVVCPATDPEGLNVFGHVAEESEKYDLATTLEQLKMQVRMLEEAQKANEKRGDDNSGADVAIDAPRTKRATAG